MVGRCIPCAISCARWAARSFDAYKHRIALELSALRIAVIVITEVCTHVRGSSLPSSASRLLASGVPREWTRAKQRAPNASR